FVIAAWLSTLAGARWYRPITAVVSGVAVTAWVNSALLTTSSGVLDGRVLRMLSDPTRVQWNTAVCLGLLLASTALAYRWAATARTVLAALFTVLVLHVAWVVIVDDHPWRSGTASRRLASFSPEANVL